MYIKTHGYNKLITNSVIPKKVLFLFSMKNIPDVIISRTTDRNKTWLVLSMVMNCRQLSI